MDNMDIEIVNDEYIKQLDKIHHHWQWTMLRLSCPKFGTPY